MTPDEFTQWIEDHRQLFGMKAKEDALMFAKWFPSMEEFTLTEARKASLAIADNIETVGRYRTEHLALIRQKIQGERYKRTRAEFEELNRNQASYECKICSGSGMVSVPHPRSIREEEWQYPYFTLSVACSCSKGSLWFNAVNSALRERAEKRGTSKPAVALDLAGYDVAYPDWQGMIQRREQARKAESQSAYHAQQADKAQPIAPSEVAAMLARLKEGIGKS